MVLYYQLPGSLVWACGGVVTVVVHVVVLGVVVNVDVVVVVNVGVVVMVWKVWVWCWWDGCSGGECSDVNSTGSL